MSGTFGCLGQQVMGHPANRMHYNPCPDGLCRQEMISSIANTGYARWRPSPSLIRDPNPKQKARTLSTRSADCLHGSSERGPSAWAHPLKEGAIGCAVFDYGVYGSRHLRCDCGVGLATQMGIVSVFGDVALELVAESVGPLQYCGLAGHPECAAQPGIAVL